MGVVSRESGVLKLVFPRGIVERHKNPVTAAEIMERNPRHCVARPDVFKFPWIVVKPESVLKLGRVFYIVPYHTLHRLLKESRYKPFPGREESEPRLKVTSRMESWEDDEDTCHKRRSVHYRMHREQDSSEISEELTYFHRLVKKENPVASENKLNTKYEDQPEDFSGSNYHVCPNDQYWNKFYRKQSLLVQPSLELKTRQDSNDSPKKLDKIHQQKQENRQIHFLLEEKPVFSVEYASKNDQAHSLLPRYEGRLELNSSQRVTQLKSCLKKHNNFPKPGGSRVRFALDEEDDHKKLGLELPRLSTQ